MKEKFKHFVIVRFNYPEGYKLLATKIQFLSWICLKSLREQTNTNFILVLVSDMALSTEGFGEFIISLNWKDKIRKIAKEYEYVITTRMDADDFVTPDFIQTIQDNFEETNKLIIVTDGYIYDSRAKKLIDNWMYKKYTTPLLSFIEHSDDIDSVYVRPHTKMRFYFKVKWVEKKCTIWCINSESIKSCHRKPEYFIRKGAIEKDRKLFAYQLDLIDKFNAIIKQKKISNEKPTK